MIWMPSLSLKDFDYPLPDEKIAQFPLEQRDASKLLIWKNGVVSEGKFSQIGDHLPVNSTLVFNDTRVIRARLLFAKPTGAVIEIFCLAPVSPVRDLSAAFSQRVSVIWECMVGNGKRWHKGIIEKKMEYSGSEYSLYAEKKEDLGGGCFSIEFTWTPGSLSFSGILEIAGLVPLPPYIHRIPAKNDAVTYQTVYAKYDGSVAAPTAGLHFTGDLLAKLRNKPVFFENVTLHVGLGTFRPVSSPDISGHVMHEEKISVHLSTIEHIFLNRSAPVIAVGTTTVRTLESLYWLGVKMLIGNYRELPPVSQWNPYLPDYNAGITVRESLGKVISVLKEKKLDRFEGITRVMIIPGYEFKLVDGIITNFHLPKSTLLMLIAAFTGNSWRSMYEYALNNDFRFLSYGDACFLLKQNY